LARLACPTALISRKSRVVLASYSPTLGRGGRSTVGFDAAERYGRAGSVNRIASTATGTYRAPPPLVLMLIGFVGFVGFVSQSAEVLAQQPTSAQIGAIRASCQSDYRANCAGVPPGDAPRWLVCSKTWRSFLRHARRRSVPPAAAPPRHRRPRLSSRQQRLLGPRRPLPPPSPRCKRALMRGFRR
jgi:hypothetical protein